MRAALWCGLLAAALTAQEPPDALSVDQAVKIALANNRALKIVSLNLDVHLQKLAADKTKRLPSFSTYVFGSQLLTPISYSVPPGQFGTYSATGPIPATTSNITTPAHPTALVMASASQPLLSLYRINLFVHGQELSVEQAKEQLREEQQTIADNVRQNYYKVMQIENEIDSIQASIKQYKELDRISQQYLTEQVALKSETLDVKAKLAREQLNLLKARTSCRPRKKR